MLDCAFVGHRECVSAGLDQVVQLFDLNAEFGTVLGRHEAPVSCVGYCEGVGVFSAGWDKTLRQWDPRTAVQESKTTLPDKAYAMAVSALYVVAGTADRSVLIYDIRKMDTPLELRESNLKRQTRCISIFPDGTGFAMGSVEGRVAIEYFNKTEEDRKYAFKCHRIVDHEQGLEKLYPVNALAFHPWYGTFASGGADKSVSMWDGQNKKKLALYKYPAGIAALAFNHTGGMLAVASSYTYEEGPKPESGPIGIHVRQMKDLEVRPKQKAGGGTTVPDGKRRKMTPSPGDIDQSPNLLEK